MNKIQTFRCACGKVHVFTGKAIECYGPGHSVYLAPEWWTYGKKGKDDKPTVDEKQQISLF